MNWKSFMGGMGAALLVLLTIGAAVAEYNTDSTLLYEYTAVHPEDANLWMRCAAYSNTDSTKTFLCDMPNAVAVDLNNGLATNWQAEVPNPLTQVMEPNPTTKIEYNTKKIMKFFAGHYDLAKNNAWEETKPTPLD